MRCVNAIPVAAILVRDGVLLGANARARSLLAADADCGVPTPDWLGHGALSDGDTTIVEHRAADGRTIRIEVAVGAAFDSDGARIAMLRDVDAEIAGRARLERGLEFERLLTRGSAALMRGGDDRLDVSIEEVLGNVGRFFGVDRAYVFVIDDRAGTQSNTHEWVGTGISREAANLQDVPLDTFP